MLTLYSQQVSGNAYKPRLIMALLGIPFRIVDMNTYDGSTRKPDYLAKNPIGRVPLIEFEDGRRLAESNAMLLHFAEGTRYLPADKFDRAKVYEWLFFEQYSHEPAIAVRISIMTAPERAHMRTPERLEQLLEVRQLRARRDGDAACEGGLAGGRRLFDRRHGALRLHASRRARRLRSVGISRRERVAQARRRRSRAMCRSNGGRKLAISELRSQKR